MVRKTTHDNGIHSGNDGAPEFLVDMSVYNMVLGLEANEGMEQETLMTRQLAQHRKLKTMHSVVNKSSSQPCNLHAALLGSDLQGTISQPLFQF